MSQPPQERKADCNTEPDSRLRPAEQPHAPLQLREEAMQDVSSAQAASAFAEPNDSDSDESDLPSAGDSSVEEAGGADEAEPRDENLAPWSEQLHDLHPPVCSVVASVALPRRRPVSELGYLQAFIDSELIAVFVTNTNLYAAQRQAAAWEPVSAEEMWRYLAVRIRQGVVRMAELEQYWHAFFGDKYMRELMSCDRFLQLHRHFHIAAPLPRGRRQTVLQKTAPLYLQCQRLFQQYFIPGRDFVVDEAMIQFLGSIPGSGVSDVRGRPRQLDYRLFTALSDGYCLGFRIYSGKGEDSRPNNAPLAAVVDLVRPWAGANRVLYCHNMYASPALCERLLQMRIRSCGICLPRRRGLPADILRVKSQLSKGEMRSWQRGQLGCLLWRDARAAVFLSTHLRVDRLVSDPDSGAQPAETRPAVSVELEHSLRHFELGWEEAAYDVVKQRRERRGWPALAWWLFDMCVLNAYRLWSLDHDASPGLPHFRHQLMTQITAAYPPPPSQSQPPDAAADRVQEVGHWPKRAEQRRECVQCSRGRQQRRRTNIQCEACGVHLHAAPCFGEYHDSLAVDN